MSVSFARQTKLSNISGRADYISNPKRQENIVLHSKENMQNDWKDYADYEKANTKSQTENNQGREIIIHLPHELAKDKNKLKEVVDDYSKTLLGQNRDFEYAVHWNQKESNLHAHIIFSERERNIERQPKVYGRNIWYNKETNRMAKANSPGAELLYKKGEVQRDKKTCEIIYNDDPFSIKDKRFTTKVFNHEIKETHKNIMNKYGFNFRLHNPNREIAQKHIGKNSSKEYVEYAEWWNRQVPNVSTIIPLREKYFELKPLVEKYTSTSVYQARINLNVYEHNGYSGIKWNKLQRLTYLATEKFQDEVNVAEYDKLGDKIIDKMSDTKLRKLIDWEGSVRTIDIPSFFKKLTKTINELQSSFKDKKKSIYANIGTLSKYKAELVDRSRKAQEKQSRERAETEKRARSLKAIQDRNDRERAERQAKRDTQPQRPKRKTR